MIKGRKIDGEKEDPSADWAHQITTRRRKRVVVAVLRQMLIFTSNTYIHYYLSMCASLITACHKRTCSMQKEGISESKEAKMP